MRDKQEFTLKFHIFQIHFIYAEKYTGHQSQKINS